MKIYLKRELLADRDEIKTLLDTIQQQSELVHKLSTDAGGAQLTKANHAQKVKELTLRLRNGNHKVSDKTRLEAKLQALRDSYTELEQAVTDSAERYQHALKELKELQKNFSDTYIALDVEA